MSLQMISNYINGITGLESTTRLSHWWSHSWIRIRTITNQIRLILHITSVRITNVHKFKIINCFFRNVRFTSCISLLDMIDMASCDFTVHKFNVIRKRPCLAINIIWKSRSMVKKRFLIYAVVPGTIVLFCACWLGWFVCCLCCSTTFCADLVVSDPVMIE